jgi:hypothetical protein
MPRLLVATLQEQESEMLTHKEAMLLAQELEMLHLQAVMQLELA